MIYGIRDEIPEHEVSYSTDNEIFVADEPMAVGTYAMRIQITDPDYENDVETQEDAVVIKEKEIVPVIAEACLDIQYVCNGQIVGHQLVKVEGNSGDLCLFTDENVVLEIPEGYEKEAGFGSVEVPYGETAQTIVSVKLKETQDDNENLVITVTTTTAEIMTITEAIPLPAVRPLFPKAEAGVRMKRVSGLKEQLADIRKTVGVLLMENGSILMQKDT